MDPSGYVDVLRNTFSTVALLVSAAIIPSLIVGLCVAVFQATTSINEQTLSFLPRLLITIVAIALGVNWGLQQVMDFFNYIITMIPEVVS
ncbi:MAG: flagellar biosynthetic protein FliQ [Succinivibrionaceae bacterium]|jgi:flagellar biosynthetic protein FliQ|nr:flagellar biosynthetic protein FliQ [Succinivibrionaceae bacterium]